jgi:lysophospholipase L1-like esterase
MRYLMEEYAPGRVRTTPGWTGELTVHGETHRVHMNSLGLRGRELGPKATGEQRVMVIGDSFVWGYGVGDDDTIPALLEARLRGRDGAVVTVGNGGAPGYGTRQQPDVARRYAESFAPDAVVCCIYLGNDFVDDCDSSDAVVCGYWMPGPLGRFAQGSFRGRLALRSRAAFWIEQQLDRFAPFLAMDRSGVALSPDELEAQRVLPPPAQRQAGLFMDRREPTPDIDTVLDRCRRALLEVRDVAAPAPVVLVVIPAWVGVRDVEFERTLRQLGFDPAEFERGVTARRLCERALADGLAAVDLTPLLSRAEDERDWQPDRWHLTASGNARVAEWVAPVLEPLLAR